MVYKSTNFISRYMSDVMEQAVTIDTAKELGLLPEEFQKIKEYLGRTPNFTELSIYSVMWSEHCSYKNSIVWLKTLPKDGPHMLVAAGEENAGLVGIGVSRNSLDVLDQVKFLQDNGVGEIILTGVNLGWFRDDSNTKNFNKLLVKILDTLEYSRLRISSIEPSDVGHELAEITLHPRFCNYLTTRITRKYPTHMSKTETTSES